MDRRLELQYKLEAILGSENVYYQQPASLRMDYPCIRYSIGTGSHAYADNKLYHREKSYELMVIDPDPDSAIPDKLLEAFSKIRFNRGFVADNLNHFSLTLFY